MHELVLSLSFLKKLVFSKSKKWHFTCITFCQWAIFIILLIHFMWIYYWAKAEAKAKRLSCVCVCIRVCVCVCVCVYVCVCAYILPPRRLLPSARCLRHTWGVRINDLVLLISIWVLLPSSFTSVSKSYFTSKDETPARRSREITKRY